ncbi:MULTISPECIES: hypothetical protein [unclassified Neisseria]|jgi:hypothetical protein|nr:hypothetical protein HMPREF2954_01700 [Neisseria sp. HMSC067H09]
MNVSRVLPFAIGTLMLMSGCTSHSAPDFPKSWQPMNQLSDQITEIPLIKPHFYEITRLDSTVKGLLERWGETAKMPVIYDHPSDFTLYKKVQNIRTVELRVALDELTNLYSDKEMVFYIQNGVIMAHRKLNGVNNATLSNVRAKK